MAHIYSLPHQTDDRHEKVKAWLSGPDRPTAVLAYAQREADFIAYAAASLGLKLGRDLSLIGVADVVDNRMGVPLTQVVLPHADIGRRAVDLLMERVEDSTLSQAPLAVKSRLHLAASCGPPPRTA
jgi:LacI family transcriptional regulator